MKELNNKEIKIINGGCLGEVDLTLRLIEVGIIVFSATLFSCSLVCSINKCLTSNSDCAFCWNCCDYENINSIDQ